MSKRCCAKNCFNSVAVNNKIAYFGLPRSMECCTQWLTAAGREDLLSKDLNKLIKYYICSEHFESDCFHDPETKQRLIKTVRPITVPIPTIFEYNLGKVIQDGTIGTTPPVVIHNAVSPPPVKKRRSKFHVNNSKKGPIFVTLEIGDFVKNVQEVEKVEEVEKLDDVEEVEEVEQNIELIRIPVCRLCGQELEEDDHMVEIFEEQSLVETLQQLMPDEILQEEELSNAACLNCIVELEVAYKTLQKFRNTQRSFREYN